MGFPSTVVTKPVELTWTCQLTFHEIAHEAASAVLNLLASSSRDRGADRKRRVFVITLLRYGDIDKRQPNGMLTTPGAEIPSWRSSWIQHLAFEITESWVPHCIPADLGFPLNTNNVLF